MKRLVRFLVKAKIAVVLSIFLLVFLIKLPELHSNWLTGSVARSVVLLHPPFMDAGGTGFQVIAPNGKQYTLTNRHVCDLVPFPAMVAEPQSLKPKTYLLSILARSAKSDLCLLEAIPEMPGISLSSGFSDGDALEIVGHPLLEPLTPSFGYATNTSPITVSYGRESIREYTSQRTSAVIYPGNSGSPVVNSYRRLVGVAFAAGPDNYAYIVPLNQVKDFLKEFAE